MQPFVSDLREYINFQASTEQVKLENEFSLKRKRYDEFVSLVGASALSKDEQNVFQGFNLNVLSKLKAIQEN